MKSSELRFLIKEIIKEIEGLTPQDRPGVMGAVNVESTDTTGRYKNDMESGIAVKKLHNLNEWDQPEEKRYANFGEWARENLEQDGTYKGEPLHNYGFIYKVGDKVPLTKYHLINATHLWNVAKKKRNDNLKLGKPIGYDEQTGTGAVGGYSTPFAFKKKTNEMTSTGAVAGYATPYAFSKKKSGSQRAVDVTKKMGFTIVGPSPRV